MKKVNAAMARTHQLLRRGDVIRTEPLAGYWGCAVVLSELPATPGLRAMCHIGITPVVRRHPFTLEELADDEWTVLRLEVGVRVGIGEYLPRRMTAIGQWANFKVPALTLLGRVDPAIVYSHDLTSEVGDGSASAFPLCGPIRASLGAEAVAAWRRVHEAEASRAERDESRARFEVFEQERLAQARAKARACRALQKGSTSS